MLWARPVVSVHHLGRCLVDTEMAKDWSGVTSSEDSILLTVLDYTKILLGLTNEIFDVIVLWARPVVSVHHLGRCLVDTESGQRLERCDKHRIAPFSLLTVLDYMKILLGLLMDVM